MLVFLASNPQAGEIMPETGGAGSFGGEYPGEVNDRVLPVIYYFHNEALPLFLLTVFAKNEKANLTRAARNQIKLLLPRLVAGYRKKG